MHPKILELGPFTIYSFGFMMAVSFLIGNALLTSDLKRKKINPEFGATITMIALLAGISGSKILYLIENWEETLADPIGSIFSPAGLTFYGGFVLAAVSIYWYMKRKGISFLKIADAVAPALLLAYGIARIGCHLAGDGDYGFPTSLPWGTDYSNGTYPPSVAFRDFPEITSRFPGGIVPNNIPCHPTPVYEFVICAVLCWFLWRMRKKTAPAGKLFMIYLAFAGIERFAIEFLRPNPRIAFGLSH